MSCLSYLSEYGSDTEENDKEIPKVVLPLPKIDGIFVTPVEDHTDNPNIHGGRVRNFPHVRGNWATFVYVKYPSNKSLHNSIAYLTKALLSVEDIQTCEEVHISVSKTVVLQYHMIATFIESLKESLLDFPSFELSFDSIKVYCNEQKSRTFVALQVDHFSKKYFVHLTEIVDSVLREFKLPPFYEKPSFHASVLSTVGDKRDLINKILKQSRHENNLETPDPIEVESAHCKIGKRVYQFMFE